MVHIKKKKKALKKERECSPTLSFCNGGESVQDHPLTRAYISHPELCLCPYPVCALLRVGPSGGGGWGCAV